MIGRKKEIDKINRLLVSNRSEFLAVTGRRRVGKTFLIDQTLKESYCFSLTGIQNGNTTNQLINFGIKLAEYDGSLIPKSIPNWQTAFLLLKNYLKTLSKESKQVIFIDELPWVATPKSNFIQMLAHLWNDYLSKEPHFILVICGSATSWIAQKIVNDPGGLHNRLTENIHLSPFTIAETKEFIKAKNIHLSDQEIARIYMSLGGIPFYLENLRKGESFAVGIERICFSPTGLLHNEYNNLYQALFKNASLHLTIIEGLAKKPFGQTRQNLSKTTGLKQNGSYQRAIEELIISNFITEKPLYGKKKRGTYLKLTDEFSLFYHKFIKENSNFIPGMWQQLATTQSYKTWAGFAFELLCHKHIPEIKQALGISAVYTEISNLKVTGTAENEGFQIDLIIDRKDASINLCEIKFHSGTFTITKSYYEQLIKKRQLFIDYTGTKKQVFITFITNHGLKQNAYASEIVDSEIILDQLMH